MPIHHILGNLLDDNADVLVNTTNVTGPRGPTMGRGIALEFARRWPLILPPYRAACASGELNGGVCRLYDLPQDTQANAQGDLLAPSTAMRMRKWAAFCTKHDWREASRYEWIESGLVDLVRLLDQGDYHSVAIPHLGCENGRLSWIRVEPMIVQAFQDSTIDVRLYTRRT